MINMSLGTEPKSFRKIYKNNSIPIISFTILRTLF